MFKPADRKIQRTRTSSLEHESIVLITRLAIRINGAAVALRRESKSPAQIGLAPGNLQNERFLGAVAPRRQR